MRAILLGHRGYVGSAFADHLRSLGLDVIGVDRDNYSVLRGTRGDVLINANGSSDRPLAERDPLASFRANVDATMASLVDFPCERYVHISTIAVYDHPTDPARNHEAIEIDPLRLSFYGFQKYLAELAVRRHAGRWMIVRLGPIVGPRIRKNSIFDLLAKHTLFFHPDSALPYVDTRYVARLVWQLREHEGEIFNVCGRGRVRLADIAARLGVELSAEHYALPRDDFDVNIERVSRLVPLPDSMSTVLAFAEEWRAGMR